MHTIGIAFFGQYRPAYFEGEHLHDVIEQVSDALLECDRDTRNKLYGWLIAAAEVVATDTQSRTTGWSIEHGGLSLSWGARAHDRFLDEALTAYPPFPGLDYSQAVNAAKES